MPITTCTSCGRAYEEQSEERANAPERFCWHCPPDTKPGPYYVSARREDGTVSLVAGPYARHLDAIKDINRVRDVTVQHDRRAVWYAFGTVRLTDPTLTRLGVLNARGLI